MLRVAVVGSGPSGCYTAQSLVQQDAAVHVDVLDRLPCPYGLVRYGVAPDHEKIKSLQNTLRTVLEHDRVRFLGGVPVGAGGVPAARLRELYHAVVYCVGAATDRRLDIPGRTCPAAGPPPSSSPGTARIPTRPTTASSVTRVRPWSSAWATSPWTWPGCWPAAPPS